VSTHRESRTALHVIVIGGGIGGLCLAQGLKKSGIGISVYERDASAQFRSQGYPECAVPSPQGVMSTSIRERGLHGRPGGGAGHGRAAQQGGNR
jgi:cation diffusion facilitator CzcD-associated flavoprotein CzcO